MKNTIAIVALATLAAAGLSACGEYPQVVEYKAGEYQGKADSRPWEGGQFTSKQEWENALANRARGQNEYKRIE